MVEANGCERVDDTERASGTIFRMVRAKRRGGDGRAVCARAARGGTASRGDAQSRLSQSSADIRAITLSTVLKISSGARGVAPHTVIDNVCPPIRHRSTFRSRVTRREEDRVSRPRERKIKRPSVSRLTAIRIAAVATAADLC